MRNKVVGEILRRRENKGGLQGRRRPTRNPRDCAGRGSEEMGNFILRLQKGQG